MCFNSRVLKFENINKNSLLLAGSLLLFLAAWVLGLLANKLTISEEAMIWYSYLFKPVLLLPFIVFQGIWLVVYMFSGLSLYFLISPPDVSGKFLNKISEKFKINPEPYQKKGNKKHALIILGIGLFLNLILIPVFAGLQSINTALFLSLLMFGLSVTLVYKSYRVSMPSGIFAAPNILWTGYLLGINFTFWVLNQTPWVYWAFKHNLLF